MTHGELGDNWGIGAAYEPYVGRWSRAVASEFVTWLSAPPVCNWLDLGCGTGALSRTVLSVGQPTQVHGLDPSEAFLGYARESLRDIRVALYAGSAEQLPFGHRIFDVVVSGLVLNFIPNIERAMDEMMRVSKADGIVAAYVWDYAGKMDLMRYFWDAAAALDPSAVSFDEGRRFPICDPERLRGLFQTAGCRNVRVRAIDVPTDFRTFDDYWQPFWGGIGPAPTYLMSLHESARVALRNRLEEELPVDSSGAIHLVARAWAVSGQAPA